jgi:hypothetical protein
MQPENNSNEQWQQPHAASSQAPFQAPETPETPPAEDRQSPVAGNEQINNPVMVDDDMQDQAPPEETSAPENENDDTVLIRWEAPEYTHHERSLGWFIIFGIVTLVLAVAAVLIIKSITFAILVPVMAVALFIYTQHAPEVLRYTLSRKGLHINDKLFPYNQFKSFGIVEHNGMHSAVLVPRKRFQLGQTVYFPTEVGEQLVDMLASRLPMKELEPDALDRLLARLHL